MIAHRKGEWKARLVDRAIMNDGEGGFCAGVVPYPAHWNETQLYSLLKMHWNDPNRRPATLDAFNALRLRKTLEHVDLDIENPGF